MKKEQKPELQHNSYSAADNIPSAPLAQNRLLAAVFVNLPCIKFRRWAISGRKKLNNDLWHNRLAKVRVWKKYFLIYDEYLQ